MLERILGESGRSRVNPGRIRAKPSESDKGILVKLEVSPKHPHVIPAAFGIDLLTNLAPQRPDVPCTHVYIC